ncbi:MAG TPA: aldehyde dehydrogenase family protein [Solirubrobacter sp.]|nr:aldehyde dehydrogenase family protein [Solirubrobacter sp.]
MTGMLIAGERTEGAAGEGLDVVNPATEETIEAVPRGTAQDVDAAVNAAHEAFAEWSKTDAEDRANLLRKAIALIERDRKDLTMSLVREQGKPVTEAGGEVHHMIHGLNYYADLATKVRGSYQPLPSALSKAYGMVLRRPMGVVAAIVPNNFPLTLLGTKLAPALMAGNTIVVKPAATTPLTTLRIAELLLEAEFPPGVVNVITGKGSEVGDALVTHDKVRRVAFTGSTAVGRHIMGLAAPKLKRMTMELGGSDPVIVAPDANIKAAARGIAIGRYWNCGQMCLGGKRLYVFDAVYDALLGELTRTVGKYEPGLGWEKAEKPNIRIGPLHTADGRDEVMEQLQDALDGGGELLLGGDKPDGPGYFMQPTIVANPPHDSRVAREETFGPVLPVWRVSDLDEAIALANDSEYGLGASVWTNDVRIIHRVANEVEAGMKWVNQFHYGYDELPFGGVKQSGYGKEHGMEGLDYYLEDISVVVGGLE